MKLSRRLETLGVSATLEVTRRASELKAQGADVIALSAGQPDFKTPEHIRQAAKKALDDGHTGYAVPASGLDVAKDAVRQKFRRENHLDYERAQIIVTVGAKEALFLAFMSVLDEGHEVILPAPYWVSFPEQIKLAGGQAVVVRNPGDDFRLTPQHLTRALTGRTRIVVLNYPNNPGGFTYSEDQLLALSDVLKGKDVWVFADELYDRLTYDGTKHISWASLSTETYQKTITFGATSKTFAMTGWRMGFAGGPPELIAAMAKLQGQSSSGAAHFNQYGLVAALTGDQGCVEHMRAAFDRRRHLMYDGLSSIPGLTCSEPKGAFYCFPNVSATYEKVKVRNSIDFAQKLLEQAHVAVVPGAAFGCDDHVRLSYAVSEDNIQEALRRLRTWLDKAQNQ